MNGAAAGGASSGARPAPPGRPSRDSATPRAPPSPGSQARARRGPHRRGGQAAPWPWRRRRSPRRHRRSSTRTARLLRTHQIHIERARARHRPSHGIPDALVEDNLLRRLFADRAPLPKPGEYPSGNRLALAVESRIVVRLERRFGGRLVPLGASASHALNPARVRGRRARDRRRTRGTNRALPLTATPTCGEVIAAMPTARFRETFPSIALAFEIATRPEGTRVSEQPHDVCVRDAHPRRPRPCG